MPICKVCGKDSFWTVDVVSKICKDCNQKKKSGKEESEIRSEKEKLEKSHQDLIHKIKDESLLKDRVNKLIELYESGKLLEELEGWTPMHFDDDIPEDYMGFLGDCDETGQQVNTFWFETDIDTNLNTNLKDFLISKKSWIEPKGSNQCIFCEEKTDYGIQVKGGLFHEDSFYYFCSICARVLHRKYERYSSAFWKEAGFRNEETGAPFVEKGFLIGGGFTEDLKDINKLRSWVSIEREKRMLELNKIVTLMEKEIIDAPARGKQKLKNILDNEESLKTTIILLLKEKDIKMPASDIDAFLKHQNVDEIKELCEQMYHNGEISRTANYRYFILDEEKKKPKPKKAAALKSKAVDVKAELKKYKEMLDDGLITQEQYDAKSNELLGL